MAWQMGKLSKKTHSALSCRLEGQACTVLDICLGLDQFKWAPVHGGADVCIVIRFIKLPAPHQWQVSFHLLLVLSHFYTQFKLIVFYKSFWINSPTFCSKIPYFIMQFSAHIACIGGGVLGYYICFKNVVGVGVY